MTLKNCNYAVRTWPVEDISTEDLIKALIARSCSVVIGYCTEDNADDVTIVGSGDTVMQLGMSIILTEQIKRHMANDTSN